MIELRPSAASVAGGHIGDRVRIGVATPSNTASAAPGPLARQWDDWARRWWRARAPLNGPAPEGIAREFQHLAAQRMALLGPVGIAPGDVVVEVGSTYGLLAFGAADYAGPSGTSLCLVLELLMWPLTEAALAPGPLALPSSPTVRFLAATGERLPFPDRSSDAVLLRGELGQRPPAAATRLLSDCVRILRPGGRLAVLQPLMTSARWRPPVGAPPMKGAVRLLHRAILAQQRRFASAAAYLPKERAGAATTPPWQPSPTALLAAVSAVGLDGIRMRRGEQVLAEARTAAQMQRWCRGGRASGLPCASSLADRLKRDFPGPQVDEYVSYWMAATEFGAVRLVLPLLYVWATRPHSG